MKEARLAFKEGTSDKVYDLFLVEEPDGWAVRYAYGRRGATLTDGAKAEGVSEVLARKAFDALLKEKAGKGYKPVDHARSESAASAALHGPVARPVPRPEEVMPAVMKGDRIPLKLSVSESDASTYAQAVLVETRRQLRLMEASRAWHGEIKLDGHRYRAIIHDGSLVGIYPRGSLESRANRFPELHTALVDALPAKGTWVVDGEIGFLDATGVKMDFAILQGRGRTNVREISLEAQAFPMTFVAFDLLHADGDETWRRSFENRGELLRLALKPNERVRIIDTSPDLVALYDRVIAAGGEGVMLKRIGHAYQPGARSKDWIKAKAPNRRDNLHVVGLLQGKGARSTDFGAFIMARMDDAGRLHYVCKAGSGLSDEERGRVMDAATRLRLTTMPLVENPGRNVTARLLMWLDRGITADISYAEPVGDAPRQPTVQNIRFEEVG